MNIIPSKYITLDPVAKTITLTGPYMDQQVVDVPLFNAVTTTGTSTGSQMLSKGRLTLCVLASSVTTGFTIDLQGSGDGTNYENFYDETGTKINSFPITANGMYCFVIKGSAKWVRGNIPSRTDGTISAWLQGGAI